MQLTRRVFLSSVCVATASAALGVESTPPGGYRMIGQSLDLSRAISVVNMCCSIQPVKRDRGLYCVLAEHGVSVILNRELASYCWDAPSDSSGDLREEFRFESFRCQPRLFFPKSGPKLTDRDRVHALMARSQRMAAMFTDPSNWPQDRIEEHHDPLDQKVIASCVERIQRDTFGMVSPSDIVLCRLSEDPPLNSYGLRGACRPRLIAKESRDVILLSRPGGLVWEVGGPSFATVTAFFHQELAEMEDRNGNQVLCDSFATHLTCPTSGLYLKAG